MKTQQLNNGKHKVLLVKENFPRLNCEWCYEFYVWVDNSQV